MVTDLTSQFTLSLMLVFITFFTSLFRLSFNKRFFDIANRGDRYRYLIYKSYISQVAIVLLFGIIGILVANSNTPETISTIYLVVALLALGYWAYGKKEDREIHLSRMDHPPITKPLLDNQAIQSKPVSVKFINRSLWRLRRFPDCE
jgi:L-asparagine transporter-like permease